MAVKISKMSTKKNKPLLKVEDIELEQVYDFIMNGDPNDAPADIVAYLQLIDRVRGMTLRIDQYGSKEAIVKHLMKVDEFSRHQANRIYNQTLEYFYSDVQLSKSAWLNIIAEKMEKNANIAQMLIKDASDAAKVQGMYKDLRDTIIANYPDEVEIPEGAYDRPNKIYTMKMEDLGRKSQPRKELKEAILGLPEVSEKVKEQAMREAGLLDYEIFPENESSGKS